MAQNITTRSVRRTVGLIGAMTCLATVGMVSLSGSAFAHAAGGGGHAGGGHVGGGHYAGGGYGHAGWGSRGGFERGGHHYHYGYNGVLVEDCCYAAPIYAAPVYVAPPLPVVVAPFGIFVR